MRQGDTIVAAITAVGGAVATVRLSGPQAWEVARSVFGGFPEAPETHRAWYGEFLTGDDGLCLLFEPAHGYTGEEAAELSAHGSVASVRTLVEACLRAGARRAEPGEFTLRAFMNGRLDLSQAEAVRDTVAAQTDLQLRYASAQRSGALRHRVAVLRDKLLALLAEVEARVDFSEEIGELDRPSAIAALQDVEAGVRGLLATGKTGRIVRRGLRIAITGAPNAGKSSLLNALLQADRAIVTPHPGTTRDTIEESVDLGGIPCILIDTAGLRAPADQIEAEGIRRAAAAIETADVVWLVQDATQPCDELSRHDLLIWNKVDLLPDFRAPSGIATSALQGVGLEQLADWVAEYSEVGRWDVAIDPRHGPALEAARGSIEAARGAIASDLPDDLASTCLRDAARALGEVTGETADADMLERIFRDFCIGK